MKGIFALIFIVFGFCAFSNGQGINFRAMDLDEAIALSKVDNKPVLFMAYQETCGHCEKMLNEVFPDTVLSNFYNKNYISVKEDLLDKDKAKVYLKRFNITSFPTFIILNGNGELLYQFVGEFKAAEFIKQGTLALSSENQLPFVRTAFENNPSDSTACYNYLLVLSRGRLATQPIVNTYFKANQKKLEPTTTNWKILSMSVSDMESEVFSYMIEHRAEFGAVITDKKVDRKIYLTTAYNLQTLITSNDTLKYEKVKEIASRINLHNIDSLIFVSDLNLYEKNKNWNNYTRSAISGAEKFVWNDANLLRRLSENIFLYSNQKSELKVAANFAEHAAEIKPDYFNNLAAAKIYFKLGDKNNAKKFAIQAKEIGASKKLNTLEAEELIKECDI